ncbi:MAG: dihydroneopterin aldolase [Candidatus Poseidonia sp.]|nr:dihydroneopterin aldolase [Poseidonia sp.]MBL6806973.1 dihydroneopterin aldolase [Poseidonia sp.]MBL6886890.1 dihydroneopterin aldolase [Poseidonia sp.]MBL6893163.1 dihydroneopterin aldolase [Poseidonia sp.]
MQWRVGLEGYEVMATHGYYQYEHEQAQPFVFTIWATLGQGSAIQELDQTLNYADLQIAVDKVMLESEEPIRLMEEMADQIISIISTHACVRELSVRIEKPQAPLPHPGGLPVIEAIWQRN